MLRFFFFQAPILSKLSKLRQMLYPLYLGQRFSFSKCLVNTLNDNSNSEIFSLVTNVCLCRDPHVKTSL